MNFFGALIGMVFMSLIILPVIMLAGVIAYDWWPIFLFLIWAFVALMRGKVF